MTPLSTTDLALQEHIAAGRRAPRVLHLINGEHYAGAERVQDLLAGRLGQFGFEVGFACLKPGSFAESRTCRDAPIYNLPMHSKLDFSPVWKLARLLRDKNYDLLNTHTVRGALVGRLAARLAGVPMVHHVHSPASAESTHRWRNRLNARIERWALKGATLIGVSEAMGAHAIAQGIDPNRIAVVPNGVPVRGPLTARDEPHDQWTIGTVALFRPRKGIEVLLRALAILRNQQLPVRLRAVGGFETRAYRREIETLVNELQLSDAVDWTGFTQEVNDELARMDLFVLPSLFGEGLPMVILEAMAAGVPVVATRVGGAPQAIRDGLDGLLATPGDADDLARVIERVVRGKASWSAMRQSAHERQAKRFSDYSMAQGVAVVYRRVLTEGQGKANPASEMVDGRNDRRLRVLGVDFCDVTMNRAIKIIEAMFHRRERGCQAVYFVNAHTLNLACADPGYRDVLNRADAVFGDGTGVRWAARLCGVRLKDNVNGTDLTPALLEHLAGRGYSYFLLGADAQAIERASVRAGELFDGWHLAGYHHGYVGDEQASGHLIERINDAAPDLLLVGMGNPLQEQWIDRHRDQLSVPVAMGVGGLLNYWAGDIRRAPAWLRRTGCEWLGLLLQQPSKARRYLIGNPLFLARVIAQRLKG